MSRRPRTTPDHSWRRIVRWFYQVILSLYPASFRHQFGLEMEAVFEDAVGERIRQGWIPVFLFIGRELLETPASALKQRFRNHEKAIGAYFQIMFSFGLGFLLLGWIDLLNASSIRTEAQNFFLNLFLFLVIGGVSGLSVGIILSPDRKTMFTLFGVVCFVLPVIIPGLAVHVIFLIVCLAVWKLRNILRLAGYSALAGLIGFVANRLSASLVQSYLFHSPTQSLAQTGPGMVLIPFLVTGLTVGMLFGNIARKTSPAVN